MIVINSTLETQQKSFFYIIFVVYVNPLQNHTIQIEMDCNNFSNNFITMESINFRLCVVDICSFKASTIHSVSRMFAWIMRKYRRNKWKEWNLITCPSIGTNCVFFWTFLNTLKKRQNNKWDIIDFNISLQFFFSVFLLVNLIFSLLSDFFVLFLFCSFNIFTFFYNTLLVFLWFWL